MDGRSIGSGQSGVEKEPGRRREGRVGRTQRDGVKVWNAWGGAGAEGETSSVVLK